MRLPRIVKLGGFELRVRRVGERALGVNVMGDIDTTTGVIRVRRGLPPQQATETFVHEVVEYLFGVIEANIPHEQISAVSVLLHHFLTQNDLSFLRQKARS